MGRRKKPSSKQLEPTSDQLQADPQSEIPGSLEEGGDEEVPGSDSETIPSDAQPETQPEPPSEEKGAESAQEPLSSPEPSSEAPREKKSRGKGKPPTRYSKFANSKGRS